MNVWIALWLVCTSPAQCLPIEEPPSVYFYTEKQCLQHARDKASEMWQDLKTLPEASIRLTCIQLKTS